MGVKLTWTNRAGALDSIKIYRSDTKAGALTLIATIAGTALTYEDTTMPTSNRLYWYVVGSVLNGNETLGQRTPLGHFPDMGPGPKNIAIGDWEFGYFGELTADLSAVPTFDEIASAAGLTRSADTPTKVRKWVVNGKIIYIPNAAIGTFTQPNMLTYKLMKPFNSDSTAVLSISKGNYGFKVRLPRSSNVIDTAAMTDIAGDSSKYKSELWALFAHHVNLDAASEANRYFKGAFRLGDETSIYSTSGRVFLGYANATTYNALIWSQWSSTSSYALSNSIAAYLVYELDFGTT